MINILYRGQVAKDPLVPAAIEDTLSVRESGECFALSDGASESFASKEWARILVDKALCEPRLTTSWLEAAGSVFSLGFAPATMSWSKLAAYQRGSFATLLRVAHDEVQHTLQLYAVGDSVAVLLDEGSVVGSFPYTTAKEFAARPTLLSTTPTHNGFLKDAEYMSRAHRVWVVAPAEDVRLICMTDALADWAFRHAECGEPKWHLLSEIRDDDALIDLVSSERSAMRLRVDDVTLVVAALIRQDTS